jgi:peptidoglycan hydrolase-like protein with peptidoglycan-binding domain
MKRIRPLLTAAAALAIASGIAMLPALTSAAPAGAAVSCTGTSLVPDTGGLVQVRVPTVGNGTGNVNCQLGLGNQSVAVSRLQIALNQCDSHEFDPPLLAVDGDYGQLTQDAVADTQASLHISVDGIYGPQTRRTMAWPVAGSSGGICAFVN